MKSLVKNTAVALLASLTLAGTAQAADQKIATVDVQSIFTQIPQAKDIQETIKNEFAEKFTEVSKLESDIKFNLEKLKRDGATMSNAQQEELKTKITNLQQEYQAKGKPLQDELQRRQVEERNRLLALIKQAIDAEAQNGKYDLVLHKNAVAFVKGEADISSKIVDRVSKIK
ncbi:OmpH family outer membrane protein [Flocculibacter collagenilyticus]|uniref:OmpH family outer membrane protein n=1 Tax=Flocculibacter collagenilyticus TaxID=2744479 RepID=UPI0018F7AB7B|nr:OmpH family outer membrane protein [Flocculibacter collagenilyticus]